ncbi:MAG: hypothetical protein OXG56_05055 [Gammaproteobacteria bacterium]|nr:hypothetical protein [Gammaproteobacteria bacterium]
MTIGELIRLLKSHPPDLQVVVNGYEAGYDDLSPKLVSVAKVGLNTGARECEDQHSKYRDSRKLSEQASDGNCVVDALVLRRVSNWAYSGINA